MTTRRTLTLTLILVPLLLIGSGCKRRRKSSGQVLATTVFAGDPNIASHFVKGFWGIEDNSWRWTAKDFSVDLSAPLHSEQRGAQLVMKLAVPDPVIQKLNSVQLSASIDGFKADPQTFTKPGQYTYTRDVPAEKMHETAPVRIDFSLDHAIPADANDHRELGIIVTEVGLVAK